jgi:hypothetical protein
MKLIEKKFNLNKGTFLFIGDNYKLTTKSLGAIRIKLNEFFN